MAKKDKEKTPKRPPRPWEGRPSKYDVSFIDAVDKYLEENQDEERQVLKYESAKWTTWYDTKLVVKLPTLEWFARYIGIAKSTLQEREKEHSEFSVALDKIREEQRQRLLNNWLSGDYNSTIAKLVLSSNHWMSEKILQETTWKDWWAIEIEVKHDYDWMTAKQIQEEIKKEMGL